MTTWNSSQNIEKLNDENYESWKLQMKSVLICNELWPYACGIEAKTEENHTEWTKRDQKALAMIMLSMSRNQLNHIKRAETSHEAWTELERIYESKGPVRKATLYKQLYRMKKDSNTSMAKYLNDFTCKAEQLTEAGINIPDDLLSIMLLSSLPEEFESFTVAIESRDEIPNINSLKIKLLEEEARQTERDGRSEKARKNDTGDEALLTKTTKHTNSRMNKNKNKSQPKFTGKCYECGKIGHKGADCYTKKKRDAKAKDDAMTAIACNTKIEKSNIWCLDSAATKHMSNDRQSFTTFNANEKLRVNMACDQWTNSHGIGEIELNVKLKNKKTNRIKLSNVIHVPALRNNLISISQITNKGFKVIFAGEKAFVKRKDGSTAMVAEKRNDLYIVDVNADHAWQTNIDPENQERWHRRYGHLNLMDLKTLQTNNMIKGFNLNPKDSKSDCIICAKGKIKQFPYKEAEHRQKEKLGLIHSDICGPMKNESLGGAKYFATFIDDFSRYTETVMLRQRSDILTAFKKYKKRVEKETGCVIKRLRTDNAKEYTSKEFKKFLEDEGIARQLTVEYTPQQNGVAERANRTLVEMARCLMIQAKLPDSLWAESINTATFLRNRCPTKALENKTPFEAWFDEKPYVGFLRIIGSKAIALNKSGQHKKFGPKGHEYILVGYSQESKAYRLWRQGSRTIIKARDVKFFEKTDGENTNDIFTNFDVASNDKEKKSENEDEDEDINEDNNQEDNDDLRDNGNQTITNVNTKRGRGRPKILRTGNVGRPRKIYSTRSSTSSTERETDPVTVDEALEREDANL